MTANLEYIQVTHNSRAMGRIDKCAFVLLDHQVAVTSQIPHIRAGLDSRLASFLAVNYIRHVNGNTVCRERLQSVQSDGFK